ncbi:MAG: glycosyltransferase family 39 protein [candidate division NC10 bacterium]|nr:glycosyltransferase family 39 protein [candidate division NC10 bacterium]
MFGFKMMRLLPGGLVRRLERWAPLLLLGGTAAFYLARLGAAGLYDPNEGMYAEIPREMILLRDWLTPHFNFIRYFEKPPLLYWLTAIAYQLLGISEFSARLITALAAISGVGVVYGIGRDLWGRRAGLVSGLILATTFGYFIFSRIILTDMLFTTLLAAAFWGVLRGLLEEMPRPRAMLGAYAAMALAILTKGLIGLAFPILTMAGFLLLTRDWRLLRRLELLRGSAVFLAITAPWHILVGLKNPGFFWFYFVNEHLLRFVGRRHLLDYAPMPLYAFLAMVVVWTFPWSAFLPVALRRYWPRPRAGGREERGFLFILCWAVSVIGFFSLTPSRLEYYSLPAFPAVALLVGRLWGAETAPRAHRPMARGLSYSCFGLLTIAAGLLPASWLFPRLENASLYNMFTALDAYSRDIQFGILSNAEVYTVPSYEEMVPLLRWAAGALLLGIAGATLAWLRRRPSLTLACLMAGMLPTLSFVQAGIIAFEPHRSIVRLADVILREFQPGDQLVIEGPYENFASTNFYTGQRARVLHGLFGDLDFGSRYPGARETFLEEEEFSALWRGAGRIFLLSDSPGRLAKLEALAPDPVVLGRSGKNWLFSNRAHPAG